MKAGLLCAAGIAVLAAAQPHKRHHRHVKRQEVTDYDVVTDVVYVTATAPNAVVYANAEGVPTSTSFEDAAPTTAANIAETPAATPTTSSSEYVAPPPAATSTSTSSAAPAPTPSSSAAPASSSASSGAGVIGSDSGYGITYSPYNDDGTCKSQDQVTNDFASISGYSMVRTYGTDCNQTATVNQAAAAKGIKLFAGVYDPTQVQAEVQLIIDAGCLDNIDTVSVGNEGVNDGRYSVDTVTAAIGQARSQLQAAGYTGKVVTVDTFVAVINNPALCEASDFAAANCHAFFDGSVTAQNAGSFVLSQAQAISKACGGKDTVITESGWPTAGDCNDQAVPSQQNQQDAIASLKASFSSNIILFDMYNALWKQNSASTFNAEHYWGMYGNAPS